MKIDLHNHSLYSDGVDSIEELVLKAQNNKVDIFALTDHDTVLGTIGIPDNLKNTILPGIELSCFANGESVHIVGLFKNGIIPESMIDFSKDFLVKRKTRAIKMMTNIKEMYNINIDLDSLLKDADMRAVTRGNMLRNIRTNNNLTLEEAEFYISKKSKAYITMSKMSVLDGLNLLHQNNCVAILAHPTLLKEETLKEIILLPFDGIEGRYPKNKIGEESEFKEIALNKNLLFSAGSDCHGDDSHANIGTCCLDKEEFKAIADEINYDLEARRWK